MYSYENRNFEKSQKNKNWQLERPKINFIKIITRDKDIYCQKFLIFYKVYEFAQIIANVCRNSIKISASIQLTKSSANDILIIYEISLLIKWILQQRHVRNESTHKCHTRTQEMKRE